MQCQQATELLSDYVDRALDPALTVSMDNHVAACADCRENVEGLRRLWPQLNAMPQIAPPAFLHDAIVSALDAHQAAEPQTNARPAAVPAFTGSSFNPRAMFGPRAFAYAAALLVLALGSLEVVHSQRAAFDPLGILLRLVRPAASPSGSLPSVSGVDSGWVKGASGSTLNVRLQAETSADAGLSNLDYRADLMQGDANTLAAHPAPSLASAQGHFDALGKAALSLPVSARTDANTPNLALLVTVSRRNSAGSAENQRLVVIPLKAAGVIK